MSKRKIYKNLRNNIKNKIIGPQNKIEIDYDQDKINPLYRSQDNVTIANSFEAHKKFLSENRFNGIYLNKKERRYKLARSKYGIKCNLSKSMNLIKTSVDFFDMKRAWLHLTHDKYFIPGKHKGPENSEGFSENNGDLYSADCMLNLFYDYQTQRMFSFDDKDTPYPPYDDYL